MNCTDDKCEDCPDWKIEQEIEDCNFSCEGGLLTSHRGYLELWRRFKALQDHVKELEKSKMGYDDIIEKRRDEYTRGLEDGITRYAWWSNGEQQVGTCGTTLESALEDIGD